jgi:GntR family transcriptional regulator / MocR family aminotransferase
MDLHIDLASSPGRSLRARLEHCLREGIRSGQLAADTRLPSTRELCRQLGVSRGVVFDAYAQLTAEGYLHTRGGGGTIVAPAVGDAERSAAPAARSSAIRYDMSPFTPALGGFPRRALATALTRVLRDVPDQGLGLPDPAGTAQLRHALAAYLGRVRGVRTDAEQIVITTSLRHGLGLVWRALAARGVRRVAVEQPGWPGTRDTALRAGLEPVPIAVDEQGLIVERLDDVAAVAVAPAHQYPTGAVLSPERRRALLDWARYAGALVIEDDYDAEYRYDHQPVGSLQGMDPAHVVYGGSTSKTLAPGLRLGWIVLPEPLLGSVLADQGTHGTIPSPIVQLAFADLIERGELDRHLRRQRRRYRSQRAALLAELAGRLPSLPVRGAAAGLYVVLDLPPGADEAAIVKAARRRGLVIEARGAGRPALVLGYGALSIDAIKPAVVELAACLAGPRRS